MLHADTVTISTAIEALGTGLAALVVARFAQQSTAEYRRRGGLTAGALLFGPFGAALAAATIVWATEGTPIGAFWGGFWTLLIAALVAVVVAQFAAGYRSAA